MTLLPVDSAKFIYQHSKYVNISMEGVKKAAELIVQGFETEHFNCGQWKSHEMHQQACELPNIIDWIFLIDTLNFSFWTDIENKFTITYKDKTYTGYWSLCAAINRAIEEGHNITSPAYCSTMSFDKFKHIMRSDTGVEIPLLKERFQILQETAKCLIEKFNSTFIECVKKSNKIANVLLQTIIQNFPSYRDEAYFRGQKVSFYKRAQILIGDIWACFEGKGLGEFYDIETLTIFADYRVPQVLVYLGALHYSDELSEKLKNNHEIENGHEYEIEIRGCTIWAAELIHQYIKNKQDKGEIEKFECSSILIDHYLWEYRRKFSEDMAHIPFHKVRCIYY